MLLQHIKKSYEFAHYISTCEQGFWHAIKPPKSRLKLMPLAKPKTGLKLFVNTIKPMNNKGLSTFRTYIYYQNLKFKPKSWLSPFVNTGPGAGRDIWQTVVAAH